MDALEESRLRNRIKCLAIRIEALEAYIKGLSVIIAVQLVAICYLLNRI